MCEYNERVEEISRKRMQDLSGRVRVTAIYTQPFAFVFYVGHFNLH